MAVETVVLAEPRGFCAGVEMAIKALGWMLRIHGPPVYCFHEIVHNKDIVERFRDAGVVFVEDPDAVPAGAPLMLSAHGSAPEIGEQARRHERTVIDAVCPLVTKVHHEARVRSGKGYDIVYVGHAGHDETVGTLAEAPDAMHLVESVADVEALDLTGSQVALLAQTTLAHTEWADIRARAEELYPELWTPGRSDLCFATTHRQAAVVEIARRVDLLLVIGSENSSNTQALVRTAKAAGCPNAVRIDGPADVVGEIVADARVVGVTAGASAPEGIVAAVVDRLSPRTVERLRVTDENEYFPLPRELRETIRALMTVVCFSMGLPIEAASGDRTDRDTPASTVLDSL